MIYIRLLLSVQFLLCNLPDWTRGGTYNKAPSDDPVLVTNTTAAKQDVWPPIKHENKEYDGRRLKNSIEHPSKSRHRETSHQKPRENTKRYPKGRAAKPTKIKHRALSSSESERQTSRRSTSRTTTHRTTRRSISSDERTYTTPAKTRKLITEQKKPVLRNRRSTRITPLYLLQQSDVTTREHTTETTPEIADMFTEALNVLRPYGLDRQINRILQKYPHVNGTMVTIGHTTEYNNIILLKLTAAKDDGSANFRADSKFVDEVPEKKIVFIVHGLSVMGVRSLRPLNTEVYFETLLTFYMNHIDKFDIFLMPMANPDGYVQANTVSYWCKNMSPQSVCAGVNLDRNFDVAWNTTKLSSPCSHLYPGTSPFSEPETRAIRDVFHHYGHRIVAYIHVHASSMDTNIFRGDGVLYPKGYTELQSDDDQYIDLKGEIDEAIRNASFQVVSVAMETLHSWYGTISGSSVDYASSVYGIPYALEFVMQPYENAITHTYFAPKEQNVDYIALTEIWKRIIDVVFNNIWKNFEMNDVRNYF